MLLGIRHITEGRERTLPPDRLLNINYLIFFGVAYLVSLGDIRVR